MNIKNIILTSGMQKCIDSINSKKPFIFVSGKAGVGKSVLIHYLRQHYKKKGQKKNIFCCAPTGVAAININASTIHKAFGFPAKLLTPKNIFRKKDKRSRDTLKNLDILIIDEISMVRADMMDAIDYALRINRNDARPFGGVQIVIVGDLFQLPPVVKGSDEEYYFNENYDSEFFFSSNIVKKLIKERNFVYIKLEKVFRQKDQDFVDILNSIRINDNHRKFVGKVNRTCYGLDGKASLIEREITLCARNNTAEMINLKYLEKIRSFERNYKAKIRGDFNVRMPTPENLRIKIGAQVMFTKNGDSWVNGSLGEVTELRDKTIIVKLKSNGHVVEVKKEKWEIVKPEMNPETLEMEDIVLGSFEQFPLMLAWAVTVHKSQGLTMDSVRIDFEGGAFAPGQVYVALSRCRTLEGISLSYPISMTDVKLDGRVVDFYNMLDEMDLAA